MRIPIFAFLIALFMTPAAFAESIWVFVGTYTGKKSQGIYRVEFDPATGKLGKPELAGRDHQPVVPGDSSERARSLRLARSATSRANVGWR